MESLLNAAAIWFTIGFVLFLLEFAIPGLILFFFAIGAWAVAILTLLFDFSVNMQLLLFLTISVATVLFFRKWVKNLLWTRKQSSELIEDEFIGKTAKAENYIGPGQNGKVSFKGTTWDARSEDRIEPGENVIITATASILLIVKSSK